MHSIYFYFILHTDSKQIVNEKVATFIVHDQFRVLRLCVRCKCCHKSAPKKALSYFKLHNIWIMDISEYPSKQYCRAPMTAKATGFTPNGLKGDL